MELSALYATVIFVMCQCLTAEEISSQKCSPANESKEGCTSTGSEYKHEAYNVPECEMSDKTSLSCTGAIPKSIPEHVSSVFLSNVITWFTASTCLFCDSSWGSLSVLKINETKANGKIPNNSFVGLHSLKLLHVQIRKGLTLDVLTFAGLESVHTLRLYKCYYLLFSNVLQALRNKTVLPNLLHLSLEELSMYQSLTPKLVLDKKALDVLSLRPISEINLSSITTLIIDMTEMSILCNSLHTMNLSFTLYKFDHGQNISCPGLRVLDLSGATTAKARKYNNDIHLPNIKYIFGRTDFYKNLTHLYLSNMAKFLKRDYHAYIYNSEVTSSGPLSLKFADLSSNSVKHLDVSLITTAPLEEINLSRNEMEYLGQRTLNSFAKYLKRVNLSNNLLYKMEKKNITNFELLFQKLTSLTHLDLSSNTISVIPTFMFVENVNLVMLDLSDNKLEHISFDTSSLVGLKMLNLRNNLILYLQTAEISPLQALYDKQVDAGTEAHFLNIDFHDNPLMCQCEALTFGSWLVTSQIFQYGSNYLCVFENGRGIIDEDMITSIQYLCDEPRRHFKYILTVSSTSAIGFLTLLVLILKIRRKQTIRRQQQQLEACVRKIENDEMDYKFLAFLSFSSDDEAFVRKYALNQLNSTLQDMTNTERRLVCTGGADFQPGFSIQQQIEKSMEQSAVLVAVISNSFCQSYWCKEEIQHAKYSGKPVILLFREMVDYSDMGPIIQHFFDTNVRAKWVFQDGEYHLEPSWEIVCESVIRFLDKI